MKYNKENLKNIYNYDPKLIDKINKNLELYRQHKGYEYTYMTIIESVDKNFEYFKKGSFVYYLTDKLYDNFSLIQIQNYIYALEQVYKKNNYNALLLNIKNNKHLDKLFNNLKYFYNIDKREVLEDIYIKKLNNSIMILSIRKYYV